MDVCMHEKVILQDDYLNPLRVILKSVEIIPYHAIPYKRSVQSACIGHCVNKYMKATARVGQKFAEQQMGQAPAATQ